jgi:hypothetical protein
MCLSLAAISIRAELATGIAQRLLHAFLHNLCARVSFICLSF